MPAHSDSATPTILEYDLPVYEEDNDPGTDDPYRVILYNCDCHTPDEVVEQLLKATDYSVQRCIDIMFEAHTCGRAIAYTGSAAACNRTARILRQIRLQVETDRL